MMARIGRLEAAAALWRIGLRAVGRGLAARAPRVAFRDVALELCRREGKTAGVDIAQMSEIVTKTRAIFGELLKENPVGLLRFLE